MFRSWLCSPDLARQGVWGQEQGQAPVLLRPSELTRQISIIRAAVLATLSAALSMDIVILRSVFLLIILNLAWYIVTTNY